MKITKNTSYALDLIKGICSICVLFMHVSWLTDGHESWLLHPLFSKLTVLMVMFFIINGFLFSVKKNININYVKRIVLRIYPIFLFIFFSNFILMFLSDLYFPDFFVFHTRFLHLYEIKEINLVVNLFFLQGFFPNFFDKIVDGSWFLCNIVYINFIFIFIPNLFKIKSLIYLFLFSIVLEVIVLKIMNNYYHIDNYFRVHFCFKIHSSICIRHFSKFNF